MLIRYFKAYKEHQQCLNEIQQLENAIFKDNAQLLKRDEMGGRPSSMNMELKKQNLYSDLDPALVKKYSLLQRDDLLPSKLSQAIGK